MSYVQLSTAKGCFKNGTQLCPILNGIGYAYDKENGDAYRFVKIYNRAWFIDDLKCYDSSSAGNLKYNNSVYYTLPEAKAQVAKRFPNWRIPDLADLVDLLQCTSNAQSNLPQAGPYKKTSFGNGTNTTKFGADATGYLKQANAILTPNEGFYWTTSVTNSLLTSACQISVIRIPQNNGSLITRGEFTGLEGSYQFWDNKPMALDKVRVRLVRSLS